MSSRSTVNSNTAYDFTFVNSHNFCKTVKHDYILILGLRIKRNVFWQKIFYSRVIMIYVIMRKQYHIQIFYYLIDRHRQMYTRSIINTKGRLQCSLLCQHWVNEYVLA